MIFLAFLFVLLALISYHSSMDPARLIVRLTSTDISAASAAELPGLLHSLRRLNGWASTIEAQIARRASELETTGLGPPATDTLARGNKTSNRAAERARRRGDALGNAPAVENQLAKGNISPEHADALANAAAKLDTDEQREALFDMDSELADRAASSTPAQFGRHLAKVADQLSDDADVERSEKQRKAASISYGIDDETGMGYLRGELHPDEYERLKRRLDAEIKALKRLPENEGLDHGQLAALALVALVTGNQATSTPPADVSVLIDLATLVDGPHLDTVCEYSDGVPLPVETARRHACTANIIPVVLDSHGMPLDVGRGSRHATPAQRRALRSMYRTCAVDGCERDFDACEIHHIVEWAYANGMTDLENLIPLCSHHHHRAHEGRWRLQLDPSTRELTVWLPDGSRHSRCLPDMLDERERVA